MEEQELLEEHLKVYKRFEDGTREFVGDYTMSDLTEYPNVQIFMEEYIKPRYGIGQYELTAVDDHGKELDAGSIVVQEEDKVKVPD